MNFILCKLYPNQPVLFFKSMMAGASYKSFETKPMYKWVNSIF